MASGTVIRAARFFILAGLFTVFGCDGAKRTGRQEASEHGVLGKRTLDQSDDSKSLNHRSVPDIENINARLKRFSVGDFEGIWKDIDSLSAPLANKQALSYRSLGLLSSAGRTEDAVDLVMESFGPGVRRNALLLRIFKTSSLSLEDQCRLYAKLEFDEERKVSAFGIGNSVAARGDCRHLTSINCRALVNTGRKS